MVRTGYLSSKYLTDMCLGRVLGHVISKKMSYIRVKLVQERFSLEFVDMI